MLPLTRTGCAMQLAAHANSTSSSMPCTSRARRATFFHLRFQWRAARVSGLLKPWRIQRELQPQDTRRRPSFAALHAGAAGPALRMRRSIASAAVSRSCFGDDAAARQQGVGKAALFAGHLLAVRSAGRRGERGHAMPAERGRVGKAGDVTRSHAIAERAVRQPQPHVGGGVRLPVRMAARVQVSRLLCSSYRARRGASAPVPVPEARTGSLSTLMTLKAGRPDAPACPPTASSPVSIRHRARTLHGLVAREDTFDTVIAC